jgi:hypothetical protein
MGSPCAYDLNAPPTEASEASEAPEASEASEVMAEAAGSAVVSAALSATLGPKGFAAGAHLARPERTGGAQSGRGLRREDRSDRRHARQRSLGRFIRHRVGGRGSDRRPHGA